MVEERSVNYPSLTAKFEKEVCGIHTVVNIAILHCYC